MQLDVRQAARMLFEAAGTSRGRAIG